VELKAKRMAQRHKENIMTEPSWTSSKDAILALIDATPCGSRAHYAIRHGSMRVGLYAPEGRDEQTPHDQDELYIIASGSAAFVKEGERIAVKAQDVLFVEAHAVHRFEDMSPDFSTWVVFWGPKGGEE
jgi:mannose-6-phosphate isomerase-like protein (cupin superfamily)